MAVSRATRRWVENFNRPMPLAAGTPEPGSGWTITDTSSSGTPTYLSSTSDGGQFVITLANTTEVENVCLSMSDVLMYDVRDIQHVWWIAQVASIGATTVASFGVASARNDDEDATATNAFLKIEGATSTSNLVAETDDAVTDNDDAATGTTLAAVDKKLHIDFTDGLANVKFIVDGARVAGGTTFDMSGLTAGLNVQPYCQLSKGSTAGQPVVTIKQFGIQWKEAYGA